MSLLLQRRFPQTFEQNHCPRIQNAHFWLAFVAQKRLWVRWLNKDSLELLYPFILGRYAANELLTENARTSRKKCPEVDSNSLFCFRRLLDFLKVLRFSFPVPVVGPSAKDFYPLQRAKFTGGIFLQPRPQGAFPAEPEKSALGTRRGWFSSYGFYPITNRGIQLQVR